MPPEALPSFAAELRRLRAERAVSLRELAGLVHYGKSYLHCVETGQKVPHPDVAKRLDDAFNAGGRLTATVPHSENTNYSELAALELSRRVAASDVGAETLTRLETAFDELAMTYPTSPPDELLVRVRRHLDYVTTLVDARKTLAQHRRLLVLGGPGLSPTYCTFTGSPSNCHDMLNTTPSTRHPR